MAFFILVCHPKLSLKGKSSICHFHHIIPLLFIHPHHSKSVRFYLLCQIQTEKCSRMFKLSGKINRSFKRLGIYVTFSPDDDDGVKTGSDEEKIYQENSSNAQGGRQRNSVQTCHTNNTKPQTELNQELKYTR